MSTARRAASAVLAPQGTGPVSTPGSLAESKLRTAVAVCPEVVGRPRVKWVVRIAAEKIRPATTPSQNERRRGKPDTGGGGGGPPRARRERPISPKSRVGALRTLRDMF